MSVYLHDIPLQEAQNRFSQELEAAGLGGVLGVEAVALGPQLVGRVLAEAVWAKSCSPHYHAAAMDGFALRAEDTFSAMPSAPVTLRLPEQAGYVDTGDALPGWANTIVPIENIEALDGEEMANNPRQPLQIRLRAALAPWSHVRPMGEDVVATQLVLPAGHRLRPVDLGAIAASGNSAVMVSRKPKVAVLPTGSELVPIGKPPRAGEIIEYNSLVLAAQVESWGGEAQQFPSTPDDMARLREAVQQAADEHDLVLVNAGSSAGSEDYSAAVIASLGKLLVHGVAVRPGHPVILGLIRRSAAARLAGEWAAVIGVPGYPVSAALTGEIFVEPWLRRWQGVHAEERLEVTATLTRKLTSPAGDDDFVRVVVGRVGEKLLAAPLTRGAGVITSLVRADGIALLPRGVQGLEAGASVRVKLYRHPAELERTILAIGSHDMSLDLLAQFLAAHGRRLASSNVGSQGGLVALRRGEAHLAGSHLLDPESGEYNTAAIRQYLPGIPVVAIHWAQRQQGLLVCRGNPKQIACLADLQREDVRFINRQRGAGTRVLLDYELAKLGIRPEKVLGYDHEEYTHLAVAAAVASGRADCGLGIAAAALALDLDFIPLFLESYELILPQAEADAELLAPLFAALEDAAFRAAVARLPGYEFQRMGEQRRW